MASRRMKVVTKPLAGANGEPRIRRLLIANRGEIASRIISTCKLLGITSIAIYTDEDSDSLHIPAADEAVCLGSIQQPDGNPHLNSKLIVSTALLHRADAIHPGYGYLSENSQFAKEVQNSGLIFVGPSPHAISVLGDKREAKEFLLERASQVPLVPGYTGKAQDAETLEKEAEKIGFPVMVKAAAGGGGRGMRIVYDKKSLRDELSGAQSEAKRSFGSSDCLLEKYIERGKHIEMQIFGDSSGNVIALGDRECSVQRRHQKIIEEAPSPWMKDEVRKRMAEAAITIGKLLQYENAGTVEFIVDVKTAEFYFLEVNTRIQVEHAITEEVMGVDIVALQLYIASGGRLKDCKELSGVRPSGHAIECRLCAEDPKQGFMPDSGLVLRWIPGTEMLSPQQKEGRRIDSAFQTGSEVSVYFDSMIAKIIVWGVDRREALQRMVELLKHTIIIGIKTNHLFLQACLLHPEFSKVDYSTNFIPDNIETLLRNPYTGKVQNWREELSFLPSLFSRWIANSASAQSSWRPFGSISTRFRNQPYDRNNRLQDIVALHGEESTQGDATLFLLNWSVTRDTPKDTFHYRAKPVPKKSSSATTSKSEDGDKNNSDSAADPGTELARYFNATFTDLFQQTDDQTKSHTVRLLDAQVTKHETSNSSKSWLGATITLSHDGVRQTYNINTSPSYLSKRIPGQPEQFYLSTPDFGTHVACERYSLLCWGEAQRPLFSSAAQLDPSRIYSSVMPCKVLRMLKAKGDAVKAGESMLVIESMKTEIKIVAAVDGIFEPEVKEGQAVGDGVVLCKLTEGSE